MKCPCCGSETEEVSIDHIKFGPIQKKVIEGIKLFKINGISMEALIPLVYQPEEEPEYPEGILRTTIYELNKKLSPYNIKIENTMGKGHGMKALYRLKYE